MWLLVHAGLNLIHIGKRAPGIFRGAHLATTTSGAGWIGIVATLDCDRGIPNKGTLLHDDVIKWKHFPRNWPFVREIHRSPVNFPHKGQWRGALMFSLIYAWINDWVNIHEAGDLRRQHGHYDVIVMITIMKSRELPWCQFYYNLRCHHWRHS